jgi:hypothetical protein
MLLLLPPLQLLLFPSSLPLLPSRMRHCLLLPAVDRLSRNVNGATCLLLPLLQHHLLFHVLHNTA